MSDAIVKDVHASVPTLGAPVEVLYAGYSDRDIEAAFANLSQNPRAALLVTTLAARHALPTVYFTREFADIGGLVSYGTSVANIHELTGLYTGRILKGEKPADRSRNRQNSTWSSTWLPPARSASKCRRRCSPLPTR
jgi:putative ABC transport system substrate-binding protein